MLPEPAALGRTLEPSDFVSEAPDVVAISWSLWQRRFGGGGVWVALLDRSYTVTFGIAASGERTAFYLGTGFGVLTRCPRTLVQ